MMRKIGKCRFSKVFPQSRNLNFSGRNAISFFKSVDKMACVGISYHPYHVFYLVLSALQQAVGHLHSFFHDVFINRAIKTDFEPLFQFGFAQKTLFGNLCDCQRMEEMIVDNFPRFHQASVIFSGNIFGIFLLANRFITKQRQQF